MRRTLAVLAALLLTAGICEARTRPVIAGTWEDVATGRLMATCIIGFEDQSSERRVGISASSMGWLGTVDWVRVIMGAKAHVGVGLAASSEPDDDAWGREDATSWTRPVWLVPYPGRPRPEETHAGVYVVVGTRGNAPDKPNGIAEIRLMGMTSGPRASASVGVRW